MSYQRLQQGPRVILGIAVLLLAFPALAADASWTTDDLVGTNEVSITIDAVCTGNATACALAGLTSPYSDTQVTDLSGSGTAQVLEGGSFEFDLDKALMTPMVDAWTVELDDVQFIPLGNLGTPTLTNTFIFGETGGPLPVPGLTFSAFGPAAMTQTDLSLGLVVSTTGLQVNLTDEVVGPAMEAVNGDFEMLDDTQFEVQNLQFSETGITDVISGGATLTFTFTVDATMNLSGQLSAPDDVNLVSAAHCAGQGNVHYAWVRDPDGPNPNIAYRTCDVLNDTCNPVQVLVNAPTAESAPSIACAGALVAVAWEDTRNGNSDIAFRAGALTQGAVAFTNLVFLAQGPGDETAPTVAVGGTAITVAWEDRRRGNIDIASRRSTDAGVTFGNLEFLVRSDFDDKSPVLATDGASSLLAWVDTRFGNQDIAYRRSLDNGATWQNLTFLVRAPTVEQSPSVSVDQSTMMIAWSDSREGNQDLAYRRSTDTGASFAGLTFLVKAPTDDTQPDISQEGTDALLAWVDRRNPNKNISYRHSGDSGATFGATARLVAAPTDEFDPACDVDMTEAVCAWADTRNGDPEPYARHSLDGGLNWFTLFPLD